ncbi:ACT domain-containing protein, partial [Streptomyces plumbiresistens]|uniref:ACT domain-containing protein n=1 Tax=Streptomyces plumbiresistens TaxID=511811 RepID=UPI0031EA305D
MSVPAHDDADLGRLIVQGADVPGIVSSVSSLLTGVGANIVSLDQYSTDPEGGRFFQRTTFHLD